MAADDNSEVLEWKQKYESCEQSLHTLKQLSHKAVGDYEDLQRKYDQNQKAYDELKVRLQDTEYQLHGLQRALEPACEEFKQLQDMYTIEQSCRSEAEKFATSINKQNKKLKRQSQMLLETIEVQNIPLERLDEISIADTDLVEDSRAEELTVKVDQLESHIITLQERIVALEDERNKLCESELMLNRQLEQYEAAYRTAQDSLEQNNVTLNHYSKVAEQACAEHEKVKEQLEQEQKLREAAEKFASDMSSQREAMVRESTVLLSTVASDQRLTESFMQIEDLEKKLHTTRDENQRKIRELEDVIENNISAKHIEDLEAKLEVATEEIAQQQRTIKELEKWKEKLEKDYSNLEQELDMTKQKIPAIPPPPPLPPASLFSVFRPKFKKGQKSDAKNKPKASQDKNPEFSKALEEMMSRIKSGKSLRPAAERRPSLPELQTKEKTSAMAELDILLKKVKRSPSVDDSDIGRRIPADSSSLPQDSPLQQAFNKVRRPPVNVNPNLECIIEEKPKDGSGIANGQKSNNNATAPDKSSTNM